MTVHVLVVEPPRPGLALPGLCEVGSATATALDPEPAARLAGAMIQDAAVAVTRGGGDLLVNHPTEDQLPEDYRTGLNPADELRDLLAAAVENLDDARFEPQVGDAFDVRIGNAVAHLLGPEGEASVAVLDGRAPTLDRTVLDRAAMKLRRSEVVLGPAPGGGITYLGLTEPIDLEGVKRPPSVRTLVERAIEAGHDVDFLPMHPRVDDAEGLATVVSVVEARRTAGRRVPEHTAAAIDDLGLRVSPSAGTLTVEASALDED